MSSKSGFRATRVVFFDRKIEQFDFFFLINGYFPIWSLCFRDCKLIRPGTMIIKVDADLIQESYSSHLNVSYTVQDTEKGHEVKQNKILYLLQHKNKDFFQMTFLSHNNYAFACDGLTFGLIRTHDPTLLNAIVQKGKIFARMLPEQKIHLIECMKDLGYFLKK